VLQLLKTCDLGLSEDEYLEVVINKTAVLIAAACQIGAILGRVDDVKVQALRDFGMDVGIAFQLMDDCLDYVADREEFGKAVGADLAEGKITLPLIHTMRECSAQERDRVGSIIASEGLKAADLEWVLDLIGRHGGIEFTQGQARRRIEAAKARLVAFPPAVEREALGPWPTTSSRAAGRSTPQRHSRGSRLGPSRSARSRPAWQSSCAWPSNLSALLRGSVPAS